jgi:hypothetical protein
MAPILYRGVSRVFAPGCLSFFKVRTGGSLHRGGLRAPTSINLLDLAIPVNAMHDLQANEIKLTAL